MNYIRYFLWKINGRIHSTCVELCYCVLDLMFDRGKFKYWWHISDISIIFLIFCSLKAWQLLSRKIYVCCNYEHAPERLAKKCRKISDIFRMVIFMKILAFYGFLVKKSVAFLELFRILSFKSEACFGMFQFFVVKKTWIKSAKFGSLWSFLCMVMS